MEAFFAGHPLGLATFEAARDCLAGAGPVDVRVSRSQVAFRRRRGFAYLWLPDRYLAHPAAEVVLSIALDRHDPSPRFKEVVNPARGVWLHHLEVRALSDIDAEVAAWLVESAASRG